MSKITNADVARRAGVSPATVSLVLNDRHDIVISETTRQRVRQAAEELGYRPNKLARGLVQGRTRTIGVIVPRLDNSFAGRIAQGIEEVCLAADHRVLFAHTLMQPEIERRQIDLLLDHQVDGIICVSGEPTLHLLPQRVETIRARDVACVVVDDRAVAKHVDCVVSDDIQGATLAVNHLLQLGHRRIAHFAGGQVTTSGRDRLAGYESALRKAGFKPDSRLVVGGTYIDKSTVARSLEQLFGGHQPPPTALFAVNDEIAAEAFLWFAGRGLRVPQDVALVGYADFDMSHYLGLTTIYQDALELGRRAAQRLVEKISGLRSKPEAIVLPTRLIIRQSCGAKSV